MALTVLIIDSHLLFMFFMSGNVSLSRKTTTSDKNLGHKDLLDIFLAQFVKVLPLSVTFEVLIQLAKQHRAAHVCVVCEGGSIRDVRNSPRHLQNLL